jgi:hypothetical protein
MSIETLLRKKANEEAKFELVPKHGTSPPKSKSEASTVSTVSQSSIVGIPSLVSTDSTLIKTGKPSVERKNLPIAPERDFQKVANSVVREVAEGVFNGKSKQMYDYLYSLTRGAIIPKRTVRISKPKLMKGTGIGSPQTFYRNINHLESLGLIKKNEIIGERSGNEYEVFLPEEINLQPVHPVQSVQSVNSHQKPVVLVVPETELTVSTSNPINTDTSETSKTSFKDNTKNDDDTRVYESFSVLNKRLDAAVKKITGKGVSKTEAEKWGTLADLLILELEVAASRADGVSSVPAFLTEVLRRQFFASRQQQPSAPKSAKTKIDKVGKSESGSYEIRALDEKGKEAALEQLREFSGEEFLDDFKKWYTPEDWKWLIKELKK